jgi:hypothetical protein
VVRFDRLALAGVTGLVDRMLDVVAEGAFIPTESADDCRFCDFAAVCRASSAEWGKVQSPLADWSAERLNLGVYPAFARLRAVRSFED